MLKTLNGNLWRFIRPGNVTYLLGNSPALDRDMRDHINDQRRHIGGIIREARANGYHWMWTPEEIEEDEDTPGEWRLGSAELCDFLGLPSHNMVEYEYEKQFGKDPEILWDSESGAIYPRFSTKEAGLRFIANMDKWLDECVIPDTVKPAEPTGPVLPD